MTLIDITGHADDGAARIDFADDAAHHRTTRVVSDVARERVLGHLLDAQRDALALGVDGQHHGFQQLTLLVAAHSLFARDVPGDIGQVHQTVYVARQADEDTEVGDRLDLARNAIATVVVLSELSPRVGLALLEAQRDATTLFVDVEHHDFDFLAGLHDLGGVDVLVGPVHFGHVHQALDAVFDFDEGAIIGDVGDLAEHMRVGRITAGDVLPRIGAQLLEAQRYTRTLAIELQDAHIDFGADLHDFRRMLDALPRHVGDVQQAIDAAEVDERTVIGDVLDHALDDRAFLQVFEQLLALFTHAGLKHGATRQHDVVALAIELDDLEFHGLALEGRGVLDGTQVDQRARQERADASGHDREATLDLTRDRARDEFVLLERFFKRQPGRQALGAVA